ncbi:hypothetical protein DOS83_10020 [Staphylococcus felis]|uniref:Uncharacterized protein n=1 Tax=Staphylococcus felis TaxID=46127 RepID=A0A3E0IMN9_9STAP|nr:hypothetical protein DOS83_10020 [Staphylococcus felis]
MHVQAVRLSVRQVRHSKGQAVMGGGYSFIESLISHCREEPLARKLVPVPQTDTGSQDENSKVSERTLVKELGKMTP